MCFTLPSFLQNPSMASVMDATAAALDKRLGPNAHAKTHARDGAAASAMAVAVATSLSRAVAREGDAIKRQLLIDKVDAFLLGGGSDTQQQPADGRRNVDLASAVHTLTGFRGRSFDGRAGAGSDDSATGGTSDVGSSAHDVGSSGSGATVSPTAAGFQPSNVHAERAAGGTAGGATDSTPTGDATRHTLLPLREPATDVLLQETVGQPSEDDVVARAGQPAPVMQRVPPYLLELKARATFLEATAAAAAAAAAAAGGSAASGGAQLRAKRKRGMPDAPPAAADPLSLLVAPRLAAAAKQARSDASQGEQLTADLLLRHAKARATAGRSQQENAATRLVLARTLTTESAPYHASGSLRSLVAAPTAGGVSSKAAAAAASARAASAAAAAAAVDIAAKLAAAAVQPLGVRLATVPNAAPSLGGSDAAPSPDATTASATAGDVDVLARSTLTVLERVRTTATRSCAGGGTATTLWEGALAIAQRLWDATCDAICRDDDASAQHLVRIATAAVALEAAAERVRQVVDDTEATAAAPGAAAVLATYPASVAAVLEEDKLRKQLAAYKPSSRWLEGDGNLERWAAPLLAAVADGLTSYTPLPHAPDGPASVASLLPHIEQQKWNACWMHALHAVLGVPVGGVNAAGLYHLLAHVVGASDDKLTWCLASRATKWEGIFNSWHAHNPIYCGLYDTQLGNVSLLLNEQAVPGSQPASLLSAPYLGYVRLDRRSSGGGGGAAAGGGGAGAGGGGAPPTTPFGRLLDAVATGLVAAHAPPAPAKKGAVPAAAAPAGGAVTVAQVRAAVKQLIIFHGQRTSAGGGVGHFVSVQLAPAPAEAAAAAGGGDGSSRRWLLTDSAASPRVQLLRERDFVATHRIFTAPQRGVLVYALPVAAAARTAARGVLWDNIRAVLTAVGLRSLGPAVIPAEVAAKAVAVAQG